MPSPALVHLRRVEGASSTGFTPPSLCQSPLVLVVAEQGSKPRHADGPVLAIRRAMIMRWSAPVHAWRSPRCRGGAGQLHARQLAAHVHRLPWRSSVNTPGWNSSRVPKAASASCPRSGVQMSPTVSTASALPSGWRSATWELGLSCAANYSVTSNVMGMGQRMPSDRRTLVRTRV